MTIWESLVTLAHSSVRVSAVRMVGLFAFSTVTYGWGRTPIAPGVLASARCNLGGLALELDGDVGRRVEPVLREQVVQDVLRRGALAGAVDRLALEVGDGPDGVTRLEDLEHPRVLIAATWMAASGVALSLL